MPELCYRSSRMETFEGQIIRTYNGMFIDEVTNPVEKARTYGGEHPVNVCFAIHPNSSKRMIVNVPGAYGSLDGYCEKYLKLALHMQSTNLGAVVRTNNTFHWAFLPDIKLRAAIHYSLQNALEICGNPDPELLLMGFSAGASAIASCAYQYPNVTKILLLAPSGDMPEDMIRKGLMDFHGEVYIVIGKQDQVVGVEAGQIFYDWATGANHKELFIIPRCDHQFRKRRNGMIMSQAPFYAFAKGEKPKFPDPSGGIWLYN